MHSSVQMPPLRSSYITSSIKEKVFRVVKPLVSRNRDVVGVGCVINNAGKVVVEEDKLL